LSFRFAEDLDSIHVDLSEEEKMHLQGRIVQAVVQCRQVEFLIAGLVIDDLDIDMLRVLRYIDTVNASPITRMSRILTRTVLTLQQHLKQGSFQPDDYELSFRFAEDLDLPDL